MEDKMTYSPDKVIMTGLQHVRIAGMEEIADAIEKAYADVCSNYRHVIEAYVGECVRMRAELRALNKESSQPSDGRAVSAETSKPDSPTSNACEATVGTPGETQLQLCTPHR